MHEAIHNSRRYAMFCPVSTNGLRQYSTMCFFVVPGAMPRRSYSTVLSANSPELIGTMNSSRQGCVAQMPALDVLLKSKQTTRQNDVSTPNFWW